MVETPVNILLVDDNPKNLLALEAILEDLHENLVRADSAKECLRYLLQEDCAVILLDVQMPEINGFETARLIREREKLRHTPIIFLTAFGRNEVDVMLGYSLGAVDYIFKPLIPEILRSKVAIFVDLFRKTREIALREKERTEALAKLEQSKERLRKSYNELDRRVQERTADLARANEALRVEVEERRKAEVSLAEHALALERANADLALRNEELDEFSYAASHDLQEPLRKLISFSDLLRVDAGDDLPETARKDLNFIIESAQRMQSLVRALLTLSHSGRGELRKEAFPLRDCAAEALEALSSRITETQAVIECGELPVVWGDKTLLTQLYQNLLGNALKFVREQPPRVWLTVETLNGAPILGVKDNGIGIGPQYHQQIFAPFRRLHGRSEYEGTGIGLAICRKVVERHGGNIWVESAPGVGTHFRFTLAGPKEGGS
ncbi:MAG: response regulator [Candidatus Hydrogenedentes bacterium]|nr:response regulator [Candidatus Hydrogenedentota bacterium]